MYLKHDREKVILTGLNLFKNKGFSSLGVDEICKSTGMTKGAFYNAFKSKENFMLSSLDAYGKMNIAYLSNKLTNSHLKPIDRLLEMYISMFDNQPKSNYSGCLINNTMCELSSVNDSVSIATESIFENLLEVIEPIVKQAQQTGDLNPLIDSKSLTELIHTTFFGALTRMKSSRDINQGINTMNLLIKSLKK